MPDHQDEFIFEQKLTFPSFPNLNSDAEGLDDMPAHVKSALIGASVTIPIKDGKMVRPCTVYPQSCILKQLLTNFQGNGHLARHMAPGISRCEAHTPYSGHDSGRESIDWEYTTQPQDPM